MNALAPALVLETILEGVIRSELMLVAVVIALNILELPVGVRLVCLLDVELSELLLIDEDPPLPSDDDVTGETRSAIALAVNPIEAKKNNVDPTIQIAAILLILPSVRSFC